MQSLILFWDSAQIIYPLPNGCSSEVLKLGHPVYLFFCYGRITQRPSPYRVFVGDTDVCLGSEFY